MLCRPLHVSTALALAFLYLVVGLTGESAHYLAERLALAGRGDGMREQREPSRGYYHCHGPDYHWHYHSREHDEEQGSSPEGVGSTSDRKDSTTGFRAVVWEHHPHACPLLAVVADLKLAFAMRAEPLPANLACVALRSHDVYLHANHSLRHHHARGPPARIAVPLLG